MRWVREGDARTRFFHAYATIRHRKNSISFIQDSIGNNIQSHEGKVALLWASFKERLGVSEFRQMLLNLGSLFPNVEGLSSLEEAFSKEEIDGIVTKLPHNKSPRSNGFSTMNF